jgi:transglutaminase-like putative cysteine protease
MLQKFAAVSFVLLCVLPGLAQREKSRHFTFEYSFTIRINESGKPLDVWFPLAHSGPFQQVKVVSIISDLPLRHTMEREYGNRMFYAHAEHAAKPEYHFTVTYDVVRLEHLASVGDDGRPSEKELKRFLQPDSLVPITGKPAELARAQVKPGMSEIERARALYDYTFSTLRYDKTGTGWGRGDALWACDAKHGNCTDFHSVFISMARSQGIPAKFEIGFPLPESTGDSEIAGYHCWAEFYIPQRGWFPVDISEAWRHQAKKEYFFGANDANRVQFTVGRDITLSPRQHGPALNYFIYPYVELGGEAYPNVANAFSFRDVATPQTTARAEH